MQATRRWRRGGQHERRYPGHTKGEHAARQKSLHSSHGPTPSASAFGDASAVIDRLQWAKPDLSPEWLLWVESGHYTPEMVSPKKIGMACCGYAGQSERVATVVNDAHLFSRERSMDLSRLNEAERRVLRLLGEGHTAKSVANATGSTAAAVNERLREARRKTGVGSSRELARLLRAQENRHEQIGVGNSPLRLDVRPWRLETGVLAMIGLFVVAAAGAAALMTQASPTTTNAEDPLIGAPLVNGPNLVTLHERVRSEARDQVWADRLETTIRARVMQIPLVGKNGNALRVTCGSSLCEIAGTLISPTDKAELDDQKSQFNRTVKNLQVPPLPDDLAKLGLKMETGAWTSGKGKPDKVAFLLYYSRAK